MSYAEHTAVPVARSKAAIEHELSRYGADQFITGWGQDVAYVGFRIAKRMVKIKLTLPSAREFRRQTAHEQATRARWRALFLIIKAKLVAVDAGISTIEREFLADVVLPDGSLVGEWLQPQLAESYSRGGLPSLLPGIDQPARPQLVGRDG